MCPAAQMRQYPVYRWRRPVPAASWACDRTAYARNYTLNYDERPNRVREILLGKDSDLSVSGGS